MFQRTTKRTSSEETTDIYTESQSGIMYYDFYSLLNATNTT